MNKLTTTLSLIFIILIIAVIVYFKSQVSYYKNAYEDEVKNITIILLVKLLF